MNTEELDREIRKAQLSIVQATNQIEMLSWGKHLDELLAMKRGLLRKTPRETCGLPRMTGTEEGLFAHVMTGAAVPMREDYFLVALTLIKRLATRINHFDAGSDST